MDNENETPQEVTPEKFVEAYNALCKMYGYALVPMIGTVPTNHGTVELTAKLEVRKVQ